MGFRDRFREAVGQAKAAYEQLEEVTSAQPPKPLKPPRVAGGVHLVRRTIAGKDWDAPAPRSDLPPNFEDVLKRRRPSAGCSVRAWSSEDPTGQRFGIDFTEAWKQLRRSWPAEADALLVELAQRFRGYTPVVFGERAPLLFPELKAACEQVLDARGFDPLSIRDCHSSHMGAIGFGRARMLVQWEPFQERPCPLCGDPVEPNAHWESTVLIYGPPRWCRRCMGNGYGSADSSAETALEAVRFYAALTGEAPAKRFGSQPMPLDLTGAERDALMAARMSMPFPGHANRLGIGPWPQMLATAGVAPDQVITARGIQGKANDGHWCLSQFEKAIDNFLYAHGIAHTREPQWPRHPKLNPNGMRADWKLDDGTMVEAAGMVRSSSYAAKMRKKEELARVLGIRLVIITPEQVGSLEFPFLPWLKLRQ